MYLIVVVLPFKGNMHMHDMKHEYSCYMVGYGEFYSNEAIHQRKALDDNYNTTG